MSRDIDALTSYTLKHLRDRWWNAAWSQWVSSHLHCTAGDRLVHVGCGNGEIDVALGLATPGLRIVSTDRVPARVQHTRDLGRDVGLDIGVVAADARALPLAPGCADAVVCVAVLQHLADPASATMALAGLLRPGGRILILEPDHESRLWYSSCEAGERAYRTARDVLGRWHRLRVPGAPGRLGLHVVSWLRAAGLEPLSVEPLPVAEARLGAPAPGVWELRERVLGQLAQAGPDEERRADAQALLEVVRDYRAEAEAQASAFVEVQHALVIATLAQRPAQ
jgi:SAM-dependent methyltransferase